MALLTVKLTPELEAQLLGRASQELGLKLRGELHGEKGHEQCRCLHTSYALSWGIAFW